MSCGAFSSPPVLFWSEKTRTVQSVRPSGGRGVAFEKEEEKKKRGLWIQVGGGKKRGLTFDSGKEQKILLLGDENSE
jgi:hypothetical protein